MASTHFIEEGRIRQQHVAKTYAHLCSSVRVPPSFLEPRAGDGAGRRAGRHRRRDDGDLTQRPISDKNSRRVSALVLIEPRSAELTVAVPVCRTPRDSMHM